MSNGILINPEHKLRKYLIFTVLIFEYVIMLVGESFAFLLASSTVYRIEIVYQCFCFLYNYVSQTVSYYDRALLLKICATLTGRLPDFVGENVSNRIEKTSLKFCRVFLAIYFTSMVIYMTTPILNFVRSGNTKAPSSYLLPYWYANFNVTTGREYSMMMMAQSIVSLRSYIVYACSLTFVFCNTIACWIHVQELKTRIAKLNEEKCQKKILNELRILVNYQQLLHG